MPDTLQQYAFRRARQFVEACITFSPFRAPELHLDEFVVVECATGFGDYRRGQAVLADQDDGIQHVAETPQILALAFREFHDRIVKIAAGVRGLKPNPRVLIKPYFIPCSFHRFHRSFSRQF